jgi:hypothetical protein
MEGLRENGSLSFALAPPAPSRKFEFISPACLQSMANGRFRIKVVWRDLENRLKSAHGEITMNRFLITSLLLALLCFSTLAAQPQPGTRNQTAIGREAARNQPKRSEGTKQSVRASGEQDKPGTAAKRPNIVLLVASEPALK